LHHYQEDKIAARIKRRGEKKSYKRRKKKLTGISRASISDTVRVAVHYGYPLHSSSYCQFSVMGKYSAAYGVMYQFLFLFLFVNMLDIFVY
jgi:hypothetical protein